MKPYRVITTSIFIFFLTTFVTAQEIDPNGYNKFYYKNGVLSSEGNMINGKPEGYWKTYYENGNLKTEGGRKNFQLDSVWKFYSEENILTDVIYYKKGKKNGVHEIYRDGSKISSESFVENIKSGEAYYYYDSGETHKVIPFLNGNENGLGVEYSRDGRIITLLTYKDGFLRKSIKLNRKDKLGRKQGLWQEYFDNGNLSSEGNYLDDLKSGLFKTYDEKGISLIFKNMTWMF